MTKVVQCCAHGSSLAELKSTRHLQLKLVALECGSVPATHPQTMRVT